MTAPTARVIQASDDTFHVFDDNETSYLNYIGLLRDFDGLWRAYGSRVGVDFHIVSMEADFSSRDEAVEWLLEGAEA